MHVPAIRCTFGAALLGLGLVSGGATGAQAPAGVTPGERHIGQPLDVPDDVPIQVRKVIVTDSGLGGTLVNVSSQRIVAYEIVLMHPGGDGQGHIAAVEHGSGMAWAPGVEVTVVLRSRPLPEGARVVPTAAIVADGTGFGDQAVVARFRSEWRARHDGTAGALTVLDETPVPATEDDLTALIDQLALSMARAPMARQGTGQLEPYMQTMAALKRLQGRGMVGTNRFARELHDIRSRLQQELEERRRTPALLGTAADAGHVP